MQATELKQASLRPLAGLRQRGRRVAATSPQPPVCLPPVAVAVLRQAAVTFLVVVFRHQALSARRGPLYVAS